MNGTTVHAYSKVYDGAVQLTQHFRVREFACADGSGPIFIATGLVSVLEQIRMHFKRPVVITSGYRTPGHNRKVKGSPNSQHLYGLAADIMVDGVAPEKVADYAETLLPKTGGIGRYRTFTHIDVRQKKSRWNG